MTTFFLEEKKTFSGNFAAQAVFRAKSYPLKNAKSHNNNRIDEWAHGMVTSTGSWSSVLLSLGAVLVATGNLVLPGSGYGQRLAPGGVLTWNILFLFVLLFTGAALGWSAGAWPRSGWAAAILALVPVGGVVLAQAFC